MSPNPFLRVFGVLVLGAAPALRAIPLFPADGAAGVCPDTPLRLTLPGPVAVGTSGFIRIFDAARPSTPVDSIDLAAGRALEAALRSGGTISTLPLPVLSQPIGGLPAFHYYPITISGDTATIHIRNGALAYGRTYIVTIDPSVFPGAGLGLDSPAAWRFTTKPEPPPAGAARLTVASDGSGDFCTVQGAVDRVAFGNRKPTTIFIRKGLYQEIVCVDNRRSLTFLGEDRRGTVIAYPNNDRFNNNSRINPYGTAPADLAAARSGRAGYHRGVFIANGADDLVLANLTIRDTTPYHGSQAEAIILGSNHAPIARAVLKDVDLSSFQDTLQINGQGYLSDCRIEGDVDFMWGTGPCFFRDCECTSLHSGAYYTQIRNPAANHGYVYVHCTFDGAPGVGNVLLSRIEPERFPHSEVVLLDCTLTDAVAPKGWLLQHAKGRAGAPGLPPASLHFWEYDSHGPEGRPTDMSGRIAGSRRLAPPVDAETIARYGDPAYVLGGWNPGRTEIDR